MTRRRSAGLVAGALGVLVLVLAATAWIAGARPEPSPTAGAGSSAPPGASESPDEEATGSAMDLVWGDGSVLETRPIPLEAAVPAVEGVDYDVLYVTPEVLQDSSLSIFALAEDGRLLSALSPLDDLGQDGWLTTSATVGIFDGDRFSPFGTSPARVPGDHPRYASAGSWSDGAAAWVESDSRDLYPSTWRLFARADADAGPTVTVAYAEQIQHQGRPVANGDTVPVVSDGRVYWAATAATGDPDVPPGSAGASPMVVMSSTLDGSDTRLEVMGAAQPAVANGSLFVARQWRDDPSLADGSVRIERADGRGGSEVVLTRDGPPDSLVASLVTNGRDIAFVDRSADRRGTLVVADTVDRTAVRIPLDPDGEPAWAELAMCGDTLTWSDASGGAGDRGVEQYVLDLPTMTLHSIAVDDHYPGAYCAGDVLAWQQLPTPESRATTTVVRWHPQG